MLTTAAERAQLCAFVQAALLHTLIKEVSPGDSGVRVELARWAEREATNERLAFLFTGAVALATAPTTP